MRLGKTTKFRLVYLELVSKINRFIIRSIPFLCIMYKMAFLYSTWIFSLILLNVGYHFLVKIQRRIEHNSKRNGRNTLLQISKNLERYKFDGHMYIV